MFDDGKMLGTDPLALAAGNTVAGFSEHRGQTGIIFALGSPPFGLKLLFVRIILGKIFGDGNILGAAVGTVGAAGTGDGDIFIDNRNSFFDNFFFRFVHGNRSVHVSGVVEELPHVAHAA